jgi:hypothetical protein
MPVDCNQSPDTRDFLPIKQESKMLKQSTSGFRPYQLGESALAAPRQMWLAGLGAAAVTRDWMQTEARQTFKSLVKEGTIVESRAMTFVSDQIEGSMSRANKVWKQTRATVEAGVKQAADSAVALAQKTLPVNLPKIELPLGAKPVAKRAVKAKKAVKARGAKVAKKAKRAAKKAVRQ